MKYAAVPLVLVMLLSGCAQRVSEAGPEERERMKRTVWTRNLELFLEYGEPEVGKKALFLFHFTILDSFKPLTEGALTLRVAAASGRSLTLKVDAPEKPGIFRTELTFPEKGRYTLKAAVSGKTLRDEVVVEGIEVTGEREKLERKHRGGKEGHPIAFSKEQQWSVDFRVEPPSRRSISSSFVSPGELIPISDREVTVPAPLTGLLSVSKRLPHLGQQVARDEVIAQIEPAVSQQGGIRQLSAAYAEAKNRAVLAEKEYGRAKRLYEAKAVPKRRVDEAEIALDTAKAALDPLEKAIQSLKEERAENRIMVRSPLGGTVVELFVSNGKAVEAGQALMRIIDSSMLWLRADIPATEFGRLTHLDRATFSIPGFEGEFRPIRLVTVSNVVDEKSRTVPVIFEVSNPKLLLKAGMFANVAIRTDLVERGLSLPEEALFEDEGRFFVFVQTEGESFERREVKTGIRGAGRVQIREGIREDERVVARGGYYVKLASLSARMPQGHGHEH